VVDNEVAEFEVAAKRTLEVTSGNKPETNLPVKWKYDCEDFGNRAQAGRVRPCAKAIERRWKNSGMLLNVSFQHQDSHVYRWCDEYNTPITIFIFIFFGLAQRN
jgi:hypothetical protein